MKVGRVARTLRYMGKGLKMKDTMVLPRNAGINRKPKRRVRKHPLNNTAPKKPMTTWSNAVAKPNASVLKKGTFASSNVHKELVGAVEQIGIPYQQIVC